MEVEGSRGSSDPRRVGREGSSGGRRGEGGERGSEGGSGKGSSVDEG